MNAASLYVHIPFCTAKCDYCDFFSVPVGAPRAGAGPAVPDRYVRALAAEAAHYARRYDVGAWRTVYVGGGTPSLLTPVQVARLFAGIRDAAPIAPGAEVTMEMNPGTLTRELLDACADAGVSRISLGIQALDDGALSAVHRACTEADALASLRLLQERWRGDVSIDLIAGLPVHTHRAFARQFGALLSFPCVCHVSLYTLTVEESTPLGARIRTGAAAGWSPEKADRMWLRGRAILERNGLAQYEVSNFARPGHESRHNTAYWTLRNYVGIGAGATGTWYGTGALSEGTRWTNTRSIPAYTAFWCGVGEWTGAGNSDESCAGGEAAKNGEHCADRRGRVDIGNSGAPGAGAGNSNESCIGANATGNCGNLPDGHAGVNAGNSGAPCADAKTTGNCAGGGAAKNGEHCADRRGRVDIGNSGAPGAGAKATENRENPSDESCVDAETTRHCENHAGSSGGTPGGAVPGTAAFDARVPRTVERLGRAVMRFEFLMLGFRMLSGVSARRFAELFGEPLSEAVGARHGIFSAWRENRLAVVHRAGGDERYALNRRGILLLNRFLGSLL